MFLKISFMCELFEVQSHLDARGNELQRGVLFHNGIDQYVIFIDFCRVSVL